MKELNAKLASLGIAVLTDAEALADPERTLLECIPLFQDDRKLLALIIAWLDNYEDLLHIERICALAKHLTPLELAWLGGLAAHISRKSHRWKTVERFVRKKLASQRRRFSPTKLDLLSSQRKGKDPYFGKFGLTVPLVVPSTEKKLRQRSHTLSQHPWFRLRSLFGANWRADIAMEMLREKDQTPYQVAKTLGCNTETVYRNWNALKEANALEILARV